MLSNVGDRAAETAAKALDKSLLTPLTALVMAAARTLLDIFLRMWLSFTSFDLEQQGAMRLYGMTLSIGMMIAVLLLLWQAIRTMIQGRGMPLLEALQGLVVTGLVALCGVAVTGGVMRTSDLLSEWILGDLSRNGLVNREITAMITSTGLPAWLTIQLASLLILVLVIQMIVLWLRNATVPILALMLPIAAAGSIGTNATRAWLPKTITAILTVAAYKPIVSLIIVAAVAQFRDSTEISGLLYALIMFVLAVIAMPALVKIFAPLGMAAAGGGAGSWLSQVAWMAASRAGGGGGEAADGGGAGPARTSVVEQEQRMQQIRQTDPQSDGEQRNPAVPSPDGPTPGSPGGTGPGTPVQPAEGDSTKAPSPAAGPESPTGGDPSLGVGAGQKSATQAVDTAGSTGSTALGPGTAAAGPYGAVAGAVVETGEHLGQAAAGHVASAGQAGEHQAGEPSEAPGTHPLERAERDSGGAGGDRPTVVDRNYG
ncbi:hypothetical protein [Nonomuraea sp. NPDC049400]|uniref:hypothetical protein n=1 Tax=Nonomuraea sp. NPDC049400 TaxID=3364352 RepID=UPI003796325F